MAARRLLDTRAFAAPLPIRGVRCVAHESPLQSLEVVFGLCLLIGVICDTAWPMTFRPMLGSPVLFVLGCLLIGGGSAILMAARQALAEAGQPFAPGLATTRLVTTGIYRRSRHPSYLAGFAILIGSALLFDLPALLWLCMPCGVVVHYLLIVPEERFLEDKFGADYVDYARRVRRWV